MSEHEERMYPADCTSAYCGKTSCPSDCPHLAALQEFKAWKARTNAVQADPIWCPRFYRSTTTQPQEA